MCACILTLTECSAIRRQVPVSAVAHSGLLSIHYAQIRSPQAGLLVKPAKQHYILLHTVGNLAELSKTYKKLKCTLLHHTNSREANISLLEEFKGVQQGAALWHMHRVMTNCLPGTYHFHHYQHFGVARYKLHRIFGLQHQ